MLRHNITLKLQILVFCLDERHKMHNSCFLKCVLRSRWHATVSQVTTVMVGNPVSPTTLARRLGTKYAGFRIQEQIFLQQIKPGTVTLSRHLALYLHMQEAKWLDQMWIKVASGPTQYAYLCLEESLPLGAW